jgi:hypothetical protein
VRETTFKPGDLVHTRYHDADTVPYKVLSSDWDSEGAGGAEWVKVKRPDGSEREYHAWDLYRAARLQDEHTI